MAALFPTNPMPCFLRCRGVAPTVALHYGRAGSYLHKGGANPPSIGLDGSRVDRVSCLSPCGVCLAHRPCATRGGLASAGGSAATKRAPTRLPTATHVVHRRAVLRSSGPAETSSSQRASRREPCACSRSKHEGYKPVHDVSLPPRPMANPHPPPGSHVHACFSRPTSLKTLLSLSGEIRRRFANNGPR